MLVALTGVQIFTGDVYITADDVTKKFFTTKEDAVEILREFSYDWGEFDRVVHSKHKDGSVRIELVRGYGVDVNVDGDTYTVGAVSGETPDMVLQASGIEIGKYDTVISDDNGISLLRGFGVDVTADGKTVTIGTSGAKVSEILKRADVFVGDDDIVSMPLQAVVSEGDEIIVKRVLFRERTDVESVPYETVKESSNLVAMGETKVTGGKNGENTSVYYEKLVDGVAVSSEILSEKLTKKPKTKVITSGAALKTPYSKRDFDEIELKDGIPKEYLRKISGQSTAYTAGPRAGTASGRPLEIGTVAVDPRIIPYGSLLYIVTSCGTRVYGAAVAADTGGFINYTDRFVVVDVFMGLTSENYHEALRWGVWNVDVYVINEGVY